MDEVFCQDYPQFLQLLDHMRMGQWSDDDLTPAEPAITWCVGCADSGIKVWEPANLQH